MHTCGPINFCALDTVALMEHCQNQLGREKHSFTLNSYISQSLRECRARTQVDT